MEYPLKPWIETGPVILDNDTDEVLLTCDVSVSEQHEESVTPFSHPVEEGFEVTDHVDNEAQILSMSVGFSDTPIGEDYTDVRAIKLHRKLLDIMYAKTPVQVITGLKRYKDMLLKKVSTPRAIEFGYSLVCDVEFVQIRYATQEYVKIPAKYLRGGGKNAGGEGDKGKQGTDEANATNALCEQYPDASTWWRIRNGCLFVVPEGPAGAPPEG